MRFKVTFLTLITTIFLIGCTTTENTNTTNSVSKNTNTATADTNNPLSTTGTPEIATTNDAPTLSPVVKAYYEALKAKDDAALRKVFSQDTLKSFEVDMKEENAKSLSKFITDLEPVPEKPYELRNEKIEGDTAIARMIGGSFPNGVDISFIKENGEWKMTNEVSETKPMK